MPSHFALSITPTKGFLLCSRVCNNASTRSLAGSAARASSPKKTSPTPCARCARRCSRPMSTSSSSSSSSPACRSAPSAQDVLEQPLPRAAGHRHRPRRAGRRCSAARTAARVRRSSSPGRRRRSSCSSACKAPARPPTPPSSRSYFRKNGQKPGMVAADMQRPAAVAQLQQLGRQLDIPVYCRIRGQ